MFGKLLTNSVKSLTRNIRFDVSYLIKIISTLSLIYLYMGILYLGLNFEILINTFKTDLDPLNFLNSLLIYIFLIGLLLLYFFQPKPYNEIIPYLHLPIKRTKIITYFMILVFFNFYNLGFILFFISFSVGIVLPEYGIHYATIYLSGILLILILITYVAFLLRSLISINYILAIVPLGLVFLLFFSIPTFHAAIEEISNEFSRSLLNGNFITYLLLIISIIWLMIANFSLIRNAIYRIDILEIGNFVSSKRLKPTNLKRKILSYALLEINLIMRNKRIKGFFITAIGFLFLFIYALQNNQNGLFFSFLIYIILNGIFGYILSQYLFSWESSYFDFLFSINFDFIRYLKAKYIIYVLLSFFVFILFLPLAIQNKVDLHLLVTALFFNSGIGYFILFYMATFNSSRIDLNRNILFNLQGWNKTQVLAILVIIIFPLLILLLLTTFINVTQSLLIINLLSIFSILNQKKWFNIILKQLLYRKHINLEGYRK